MKKLIYIIAIFVLLFSCESSDPCSCVKETYKFNQGVTNGSNGLPVLTFDKEILNVENIECNDEVVQESNEDNTYFDIICD